MLSYLNQRVNINVIYHISFLYINGGSLSITSIFKISGGWGV